MKIVRVDNYDREIYDDDLIVENVNEIYGEELVEFLNSKEPQHSDYYFRLVENDYKLYKFEP